MSLDRFWDGIAAGLTRISTEKPQTFDGVKAILDTLPGGDMSNACDNAKAFFGGSGGDLALNDALRSAGWHYVWIEASYHWAMRSPTGEILTYVEGDVYRGDDKETPLPCGCIPHQTHMTNMGTLYCDTEQNAYCNFECPHEDEESS